MPHNLYLAMKRLTHVTNKLLANKLNEKYEEVPLGWLGDKSIQAVPEYEKPSYGLYLFHRPVIKEKNSSTPVRPLFDALAKIQNHPSLNQCLHYSPNLTELIPDTLLRFRDKFGAVADIKKAFLQICICKEDPDFF